MAKKALKRRVFDQEGIIKAMTSYVEQLERKVSLLQDGINILQTTSKVVRGSYGKDKTVVKKGVKGLAKSIPNLFIGMVMSMSRAISEWCTRHILKMKHLSEHRN